eukprot:CAMPEP_0113941986 /NCGR_PEP_ID=MMETSP1339-20121228/7791_1 /TAXON_ID=94617 /ORGANISM="Fibrocapsa japonica" /LENGTH=310 /DNA_ID=CAMNT_0000946287 /DNA_START=104 /DNA_END=1036 /DNA_ORIENTATION=- /assembly_acc=CAM_ASM_000762
MTKSIDLVRSVKAASLGFSAGCLGSMVGMGGGFLLVPTLGRFMNISQHKASGTSLLVVLCVGISGAASYGYQGLVDWETAAILAGTGMFASRLGAQQSACVSSSTLKKSLGGFMLAMAPLVVFNGQLKQQKLEEEQHKEDFKTGTPNSLVPFSPAAALQYDNGVGKAAKSAFMLPSPTLLLSDSTPSGEWQNRVRLGAVGVLSGFASGFFGLGGGVATVPALTLATDNRHQVILGTSLMAMVLPSLVGVVAHFSNGNIAKASITMPLVFSGVAGAFIGSQAAAHVDETSMRGLFAILMAVLGGKQFLLGK